jgi:hypothetical protein
MVKSGHMVVVLAASLAGCSPSGQAGRCAGYLGCSGGAEPPSSTDDAGAAPEAPPAPARGFPAPDDDAVAPSPGCGQPLTLPPPTDPMARTILTGVSISFTGQTLSGPTRDDSGASAGVHVPVDYNPNRAYRLVYDTQGCVEAFGCPTLYDETRGGLEEAIYVEVPFNRVGTVSSGAGGSSAFARYDTTSALISDAYEFFALLHAKIEQSFCIDENRVSVEGQLAEMWGCYFAGDGHRPATDPSTPRQFAPDAHVRAQVVAADGPPDQPPCNGPVATLLHGTPGPFDQSDAPRLRALAMNGCSYAPLVKWHPDQFDEMGGCFAYTSCPAGYPVVWCSADVDQVATLMTFLDELPPPP